MPALLSKRLISEYITTNCDRRLLLDLAGDNPGWFTENVSINKRGLTRLRHNQYIMRLGKEYERKIYTLLMNCGNCIPNHGIDNDHLPHNTEITPTHLGEAEFRRYYERLGRNFAQNILILLEHEYNINSERFFEGAIIEEMGIRHRAFNGGVDIEVGAQRPDIIILGSSFISKLWNLVHGTTPEVFHKINQMGDIEEVEVNEGRPVAISIIDIKSTTEKNIGKHQFIEIIFYMRTLASFLHEFGLDNDFFVSADFNGILPQLSDDELNELFQKLIAREARGNNAIDEICSEEIAEIFAKSAVFVNYLDYKLFFDNFIRHIVEMAETAPHNPDNIDDSPPKIQPLCGLCRFQLDCIRRLGVDDPSTMNYTPENLSVKLIPYISNSLSEQLFSSGIRTLRDLRRYLSELNVGTSPHPIYPEKPILELKIRALIERDKKIPSEGSIYSTYIPKNTNFKIIFAIETDTHHRRVFGYSIFINLSPFQHFLRKFQKWFAIWEYYYIKKGITPSNINERIVSDIIIDLKNCNLIDLSENPNNSVDEEDQGINDEDSLKERIIQFKKDILQILKSLSHFPPKRFRFRLNTDNLYEQTNNPIQGGAEGNLSRLINNLPIPEKHPRVLFYSVRINDGLYDDNEFNLLKYFISEMHALARLCTISRKYLTVIVNRNNGNKEFSPITAVYYWGREQIKQLDEWTERHLERILMDAELSAKLYEIYGWLTPAESEIEHPNRGKILFDLKQFAQTAMAFPILINYSWHSVAELLAAEFWRENPPRFSEIYWPKFQDYMDYQHWFYYLQHKEQGNSGETVKKKKQILKQLLKKAKWLFRISIFFESKSRSIISRRSFAISPDELHYLYEFTQKLNYMGRTWYIFSRLEGSTQIREAEFLREMYPEYGIGKLDVGKVSDLRIEEIPSDNPKAKPSYRYIFNLTGLSQNLKISEGDYFLLLPEQLRDLNLERYLSARKWTIIIKELIWDDEIDGYRIESEETKDNIYENYILTIKMLEGTQLDFNDITWYLYPHQSDSWTGKLIGTRKGREIGLLRFYDMGLTPLGDLFAYRLNLPIQPELDKVVEKISQDPAISIQALYLYYPEIINNIHRGPINRPALLTRAFPRPDPSQSAAILDAQSRIFSLIQGPPGTGKSKTIANLIDDIIIRRRQSGHNTTHILVMAFSYAAIKVVLEKVCTLKDENGDPLPASRVQQLFIRSISQTPAYVEDAPRAIEDVVRYKASKWQINERNGSLTKNRPLNDVMEREAIVYANAHQLFNLYVDERISPDFSFDFIIIDEASQLPSDHILSAFLYLKGKDFRLRVVSKSELDPNMMLRRGSDDVESNSNRYTIWGRIYSNNKTNDRDKDLFVIGPSIGDNAADMDLTHVIIVGDNFQLPPVRTIEPPKKLNPVLSSLFNYYVNLNIPINQLEINYRSHEHIVRFTSSLGFYRNLRAFERNAAADLSNLGDFLRVVEPWKREILDPRKVVCTLIHEGKAEMNVSEFEANIVAAIVEEFFNIIRPRNESEEIKFWNEYIGIVAPHNAQGRLIIRKIVQKLTGGNELNTNLDTRTLMKMLKSSIYSVEKFQGSDREFIIASIAISDPDRLAAEEEFIYDLYRFNVLTTRAKKKVLLICSRQYLSYMPNDKLIMEYSGKIRNFALIYCDSSSHLRVPFASATQLPQTPHDGDPAVREQNQTIVEFRWHQNHER